MPPIKRFPPGVRGHVASARRGAAIFALLTASLILTAGIAARSIKPASERGRGVTSPLPAAGKMESVVPVSAAVLSKARAQAALGGVPAYFVENRGQFDGQVSYYAQGSDRAVFMTGEGITFALIGQKSSAADPANPNLPNSETGKLIREIKRRHARSQGWAVKLDFVGANTSARAIASDETPTTVNYFRGAPEQWKTGLKTFNTITYQDLWPGIDLVYKIEGERLKYQFVVKPGADPDQIRLAYRGAGAVRRNAGGRLEVETPVGGFTDEKPYSYQESGVARVEIESAFALNDSQPGKPSYGFSVGAYDRSLPLVIDPAVLLYAGYVGGTGDDYGDDIALGSDGSAYITGYTFSSNFPASPGAYDTTLNTGCSGGGCLPFDTYVAKVNPGGTALTYASYLGGNGDDYGFGIAVDNSGNAYVTGLTTSSSGFPITTSTGGGAVQGYQTGFGGLYDSFLIKLNSTGSALTYGTYLGGTDYDEGQGVAVDNSGRAYLVGYTTSTNYPVSVVGGGGVAAYRTTNAGVEDVYVTKLDTLAGGASSLNYSTYLGGSGVDFGWGIAINGTLAYVTGSTTSTNFPTSGGAYDTSHNGSKDAFVTELNTATGGTPGLVYSTFLGGASDEEGKGIALDASLNAYITGYTNSVPPSFPVTVGPDLFQNGHFDAFITKFNAAGSALVYSGYLGGSGEDRGTGIAVDSIGNAYISGFTNSPTASFPVLEGPGLIYNAGVAATCTDGVTTWNCFDAFVAKIGTGGARVYAGYVGGSADDQAGDIAVDSAGNAYIAGYTGSSEATFPDTIGPDLTFNGLYFDAFVAKVQGPIPSITINDVTVAEGNAGMTNAAFNVTLSAASTQTVTVNYTTANGTATAGSDYTAASGTLTFNPGTTTQTINVSVSGDTIFEANETFFVDLSSAANATISDAQGQGTINNDEANSTFAFSASNYNFSEAGPTATITVSRTGSTAGGVTVNYATANGTAASGSDYTSASGTLTFNSGETSKSFSITILEDTLDESDETVNLTLSSPFGGTLGSPSTATLTITDNDAQPSLQFSTSGFIVAEGGGTATITVTRTGGTNGGITVNYATSNGSATAGSDYTSASGTLSFAADEVSKTFNVPISNDSLDEADETLNLTLSSATGGATLGSPSAATLTITDNDPTPTLTISDVSAAEGNGGTSSFVFTVSLSAASGRTITVDYATANGTATAGSDYTSTSGTLTIPAGSLSGTITITVTGDTTPEPHENFFVNLSNAGNVTILDAQGQGTVSNDDASLSINDATVTEGNAGTINAQFNVLVSAASVNTVTVNYATANGTAASGSDYTTASGTLTFNPGETSKTINVSVTGDTLDETNETFFVNLSSATNASISDSQGLGTITDDDASPVISVSDATGSEGGSRVNYALASAGAVATAQNFTADTVYPGLHFQPSYTNDGLRYITPQGDGYWRDEHGLASWVQIDFAGQRSIEEIDVYTIADYPAYTVQADPSSAQTFTQYGVTAFDVQYWTGSAWQTIEGGSVTGNNLVWRKFTFQEVSTTKIRVVVNSTVDGVARIAEVEAWGVQGPGAGPTSATFNVTLSAVSGRTVTVNYSTADGTASAPGDYTAATGTVTFNPGETSKNVVVPVIDDASDEPAETFTLNLSAETNATISDAQGQGTITDNDPLPSVSVSDVVVAEGNAGATNAQFNVTLSAASGKTVTVNYATANGTAASGSDYTTASGTLTFNPGETSKTINVSVTGDTLDETNETFFVNLSSATNASISDSQGLGTITDDDLASSITINDVTVVEGSAATTTAAFNVTLSAASGQTVTVNYATADGTATAADSDYQSNSGTLTFTPGETQKSVSVLVNGDVKFEGNETFVVNLSSPSNAMVSDAQGQGSITNDDSAPSFTIDDVTLDEGNAGTTSFTFTVSKSGSTALSSSVNFATSDGTAAAGSDYTAASGTLNFAASDTSKTITILVNGDTSNEPNETFSVQLSGASNASISDSQGQGTITNDDSVPSLSIDDVTVTEGNAGTTNASFTVTLSAASGQIVTVGYATADGTAAAGSDYTSNSNTLTFSPGELTKNVTVFAGGDTSVEPSEVFFVNLSSPTNATIGDAKGVGTIITDDMGALGGKIAFRSDRDGNAEIYVMNADGSAQTRLTNNSASDTAPAFSADGTKIAFVSDRDGNSEIYIMNADGTNQTRLTNDTAHDSAPAISPDGSRIAFRSDRDGNAEIYVMNVDGSAQTRLTNNTAYDSLPSFNHDGSRIAFTSNRGASGHDEIFVMNADGSSPAQLTDTIVGNTDPAFSPDGAKITFKSQRDGSLEIYSMNADGSAQTRLTSIGSVNNHPAFGPDASRIAFESDRDGNLEIYVMNADGSAQTRLTNNSALDEDPSWAVGDVALLSVGDVTLAEGNSGTTNFNFNINRSGSTSQTATVRVDTADGTAGAPADYTAITNQTVTFLPGETSKQVTVLVNGDTSFEGDETFYVNLSSATNALIGDGQGLGTITNDDADSADLSITKDVTPTTASPGATITYTLTVNNNGPGTATNLTVTDNLPTQTTFVSCNISAGGTCGGTGNNRDATFASLAAGASVTVTLTATLNCGTVNGTVGNTASVSSSTADPVSGNNTANVNLTVADTTSISPASQTFNVSGGAGSVSVTTGCGWTAVSNSGWITISSGASGTGNGTVNYSVAANTTGAPRTGTLTVAGMTFKVFQETTVGGLYVDCTFTGTELGTISQPFRTVNAAINAASPNQVIWIRGCNYNETLNSSGKAVELRNYEGPINIGTP